MKANRENNVIEPNNATDSEMDMSGLDANFLRTNLGNDTDWSSHIAQYRFEISLCSACIAEPSRARFLLQNGYEFKL